MRIMFNAGAVTSLLACLFAKSDAFISRINTELVRIAGTRPSASRSSVVHGRTNNARVDVISGGRHNALSAAIMRAQHARSGSLDLAKKARALHGRSPADSESPFPGLQGCKGFVTGTVAGGPIVQRQLEVLGDVGRTRLAPQAALGRPGGKGTRGSLKMGLRRARQVLRQVFGSGSPAAKAAAAAGIARGKGLRLPPGGDIPPDGSPIDVEGVLRQSQLLMKDGDAKRVKRVLILMSDTGGGHRASAEALEAAFDELYPGAIDVDIVDVWTAHAPWPLNKFVQAYQFMAKRPLIWRCFWEYGRFPPTRRLTAEITNLQCHQRFRALIEGSHPDLVISVHPLCQDIPMRVMKKMGGGKRTIPFVTVVTDLGGAHPTWFHRDIDMCFVPSDRLAAVAQDCGLSPRQIKLHGLPIRPGFSKKPEQVIQVTNSENAEEAAKEALQRKLGLKPGVKACLVVGGGDGVGGLKGIADSVGAKLAEENTESQVVVVCGTNQEVMSSLEKESWASNVHKHVKGFVSNMDEWMGAVDCIVTKAGPGTIAEATTRGLPVMLSAFLPGQEAGNVPFVTEGGFGAFSRNPTKIAETVSRWLRDDELRAEMSKKAKAASRPEATHDICRDIGRILGLDAKLKGLRLTNSMPAMA